jgi:hypothetical protein
MCVPPMRNAGMIFVSAIATLSFSGYEKAPTSDQSAGGGVKLSDAGATYTLILHGQLGVSVDNLERDFARCVNE